MIDINQLSSDDLQNATLNAANAAAEDWDISNGVIWRQITKIYQPTLISLRQLQVKALRLSWVMMIQIMRQQSK